MADDYVWTKIDVTCASCAGVNQLHEQKPEWLETPEGVKWECNHCEHVNTLGGVPKLPLFDVIMECGHCGTTFDGRPDTERPEVVDGAWDCPVCSVTNRNVSAGESASSKLAQEVSA